MMNRNVALLVLMLALVPQSARPDGAFSPSLTRWKQQRERALITLAGLGARTLDILWTRTTIAPQGLYARLCLGRSEITAG
ncbi:MAG: hypothetical protein JO250_08905 [Armatimonadetes bacterium]|nr:hypothetical protein [Armatimonadota bacterium]